MRRLAAFSTIFAVLSAAAITPAFAQATGTASDVTAPGGNVSTGGRKMPPAAGRVQPTATATDNAAGPKAPGAKAADAKVSNAKVSNAKVSDAKTKAATEADMLRAQKAAEARNKAWDSKMRKTMGSICSGC